MAKHGVYSTEKATSVSTPVVAQTGIPFVIGISPVQSAETPATLGKPVLCTSWAEAVEAFGYSDDWASYTLCEFMYSHFKLYGAQPVVLVNVLDPATMKTAVPEASKTVTNHKVALELGAIIDAGLTVEDDGTALVKGTDFEAYYSGEHLIIELKSTSASYSASTLDIAYNKVNVASVTTTVVGNAIESIELCLGAFKVVPDLIVIPKFSSDATVAALMATKAESINGLFQAKALIDIDATSTTTYTAAIAKKSTDNFTDAAEVPCWPMVKLGDKIFHMSTQIAGLIAQVDTENGGCPYESPSNKTLKATGLCLANGTEVELTLTQANLLNSAGIMTALSFIDGLTAWGNYTGCYPASTDVKDYYIPVSRMFDWVANTLIKTFWKKLDKPMNRRLIDSILDSANIWLNGLVGEEYLLGARVEMLEEENPLTNLMAGIIKLHVYMTPPSPAQEIDFELEYDADYVQSALM